MRTLAEETILLPIKVKKVYKILSNIKNYSKFLAHNTSDWSFDGDVCSFLYDGSTPTKLKMYERKSNEKILIGTFGNNSVDFDMEFLMFDLENKGTNFKMIIKADMNPIMASMASSFMEELKIDFIAGMKKVLNLPLDEEKLKKE
ncbi:MAG: hypothetical protein KAG64_07150 [Bacteroidales bacterium]|nr:hypothetical protein [Bacteroidales bacterium]